MHYLYALRCYAVDNKLFNVVLSKGHSARSLNVYDSKVPVQADKVSAFFTQMMRGIFLDNINDAFSHSMGKILWE